MSIVIVIPVYKNPDVDELISLRRCCQILSRYEMSLVCPEGFDTSAFHSLWNEYGLVIKENRFEVKFFKNIAGYNRLLLSEDFYARFAEYDYMLIYQPDAYVFVDRLEEWCNRGYDYVGAPVLWDFDESLSKGWVGNGGLSLRRVRAFTDYFMGQKNVIPTRSLAQRIDLKSKWHTRWLVWCLAVCGWHNRPKSFANHYIYNEDQFWCCKLNDTNYRLNIPHALEAVDFAFERFPKELFGIIGHLPFGTHAWKKYEYEEFWKERIE